MRAHLLHVASLVSLISLSWPARAEVAGEPGTCNPPCRSGYMCQKGQCLSLCNPPCHAGEQCVKGECELLPIKDYPAGKWNYLGVLGVFQGGLNSSAANLGEVRVEFGGPYGALQVGPTFGNHVTMLRTAIQGHVPFQPLANQPFFLVPTIALGYSFGWVDDAIESRLQDIFIVPGLRLRYDFTPRLAIFADLVQVQINFIRLYSSKLSDVSRQSSIPVTWNLGLGLGFLY